LFSPYATQSSRLFLADQLRKHTKSGLTARNSAEYAQICINLVHKKWDKMTKKRKKTKNNEEKAQNFGWRTDFTQLAGELLRLGLFR
jgi:hypothetical protein